MKKGKFIVIDGTDGSGKATQTKFLVERLKKDGFKVKTIDFPRYYNNFFGKFIGEGLTGKYGNWAKLDPHIASTFYAIDRFESSARIKKWLKEGVIVISDRYASSNQIHQGGKILNGKKRLEFLKWLEEMEYGVFEIPRPDRILYLDVPLDLTRKLMEKENKKEKKAYQKGKKDLHEIDPKHLERAKKSAMKMIEKNNNWTRINCLKAGNLMSIEEISDQIWDNIIKIVK
jgi:dTMP kinase